MADVQRTRDAEEYQYDKTGVSPVSSGQPHEAAHWNPEEQAVESAMAGAPSRGHSTRGFRTVLGNHYFLRLWMAQLLSQTIMNAANYGLVVLIAQRSSSYLATSFAIVAFALPAMLFGAPAGVLVDRMDRRRVLWVSNLLRAIAAFGFSVSLFLDQRAILPAYAVSFFIATVGQFFAPAEGAAIPLLVHREELINALSLFNITFTIAQALGLIILAPAIVAFVPVVTIGTASHNIQIQPIDSLFIIVGLLYLLCTALILTIPHRMLRLQHGGRHPAHVAETDQLRSIWNGILECSRFILNDRRLLISVLQLCIGGTIVAIVAMVAPGFVQTFFQRPPEQAFLVFFPAGVGLVLGSAVTPKVVQRIGYNSAISVGVIMFAASAILLVVAHSIALHVDPQNWSGAFPYVGATIILTFFLGVALDFINVPAQTIMQQRSPDWIKGRVLSVQAMVLNGATVIFVPLMGLAADHLGISVAVVFLGIIVAATGLPAVYLASRVSPHEPAMRIPRPPQRRPIT